MILKCKLETGNRFPWRHIPRANVTLAVILVLAMTVADAATAANRSAPALDVTLVATIAADNKSYEEAMARGDARAAAGVYESTGVFIAPGPRILTGRTQIQAYIARVLSRVRYITGTCQTDHLSQDGDQAYEAGHCSSIVEISGRKVSSGGDYLTVWRRQHGGAWLIEINAAP